MKRKTMASRPRKGLQQRIQFLSTRAASAFQALVRGLKPWAVRGREGIVQRPVLATTGLVLVAAGVFLGTIGSDSGQPAGEVRSVDLAAIEPIIDPAETPPLAGLELGQDNSLEGTNGLAVTRGPSGHTEDLSGMEQGDLADQDRDWTSETVRSGDTLERIFRRVELGPGLLHQVVTLDDDTRGLARIRPGDQIDFHLCPDEGFKAIRAELDDENWLVVEKTEEGLASQRLPRALEVEVVEAAAEIRSNLFNAGSQAGLSDGMIMRLANIFGWDVDFALDIRPGDNFALIYERIYRDGNFLRDGNIIAARFTNRGNTYDALRFKTADGADYFNPEGRPMRRAFLRAPLNFTRVTSDFNPRRFHPVTRRTQPHNGIDYGAPTGTPVWASGDGRVIESGYGRANGNYVFIRHGNNIVTRYLHLNRRHVNRGDRVRQGETIGTVGATGMATGPHLHYEFLVDGTHRNPRTVDLPEADPLPEAYLPRFEEQRQELLARLDEADLYPLRVASGSE